MDEVVASPSNSIYASPVSTIKDTLFHSSMLPAKTTASSAFADEVVKVKVLCLP